METKVKEAGSDCLTEQSGRKIGKRRMAQPALSHSHMAPEIDMVQQVNAYIQSRVVVRP